MDQPFCFSTASVAAILALPIVVAETAFAQGHELHHPQGAVIALTIPDVSAAGAASANTPVHRLMLDDELLGLREIMGEGAGEKMAASLEQMEWQRYLEGAESLSLSVTPTSVGGNDGSLAGLIRAAVEGGDGGAPWGGIAALGQVQCVVDFEDTAAANAWSAQVQRLMDVLALELLPEPLEPMGAEMIGFTEDASSFARYAHEGGVDTAGVASRITVGSRVVVRIGGDVSVSATEVRSDRASLGPWTEVPALKAEEERGPLLLDLFISDGAFDGASQFIKELEVVAPLLGPMVGLLHPAASILTAGGRWQVYLNGGDDAFRGVMPAADRAHAGVFGAQPLADGTLSLVHPDAQVAHVVSLDAVAMGQWIEHAAEVSNAVEFLAEYGIDPLEVFSATFGTTVSFEVRPIKGLVTMPDLYLIATLKDPAGIAQLVGSGKRIVADLAPEGAAVLQSTYRGAMVHSFQLPTVARAAASVLGLQPTIVVTGDLAMLTLSIPSAKRWIREQGKERPVHAGLMSAKAPKGASSVTFGDWGGMLDDVYGHALAFAPLAERFLGGNPETDVASIVAVLPKPGIFKRYFKSGFSWTQRMESGNTYYAGESPGGCTGFVCLIGLGATIVGPKLFDKIAATERKETQATIMLARRAVDDYMLDNGEMPEELEVIRAPLAARFPRVSNILTDAWGRALRYRVEGEDEYLIWSLGPNGVDEGGEGDDILGV